MKIRKFNENLKELDLAEINNIFADIKIDSNGSFELAQSYYVDGYIYERKPAFVSYQNVTIISIKYKENLSGNDMITLGTAITRLEQSFDFDTKIVNKLSYKYLEYKFQIKGEEVNVVPKSKVIDQIVTKAKELFRDIDVDQMTSLKGTNSKHMEFEKFIKDLGATTKRVGQTDYFELNIKNEISGVETKIDYIYNDDSKIFSFQRETQPDCDYLISLMLPFKT